MKPETVTQALAEADYFTRHICELITGKAPEDCSPHELEIAGKVLHDTARAIIAAQEELGRVPPAAPDVTKH